jgi:hypothetical protein
MEKNRYEILRNNNSDYKIPLFLDSSVDEMGVMVGFDGDIEQIEQLINFHYTGSTSTANLTVFNTVNGNKYKTIVEQNYTINWGDGSPTSEFQISLGETLNSLNHTYSNSGTYNVSISLDTPWTKQKLVKQIKVPISDPTIIENEFGTFTGLSIPSEITLNYLNNLDYTNNTGYTTFTYLSIGRSRINELKKYGETGYIQTLTTGQTEGNSWTGYTIDDLQYRDYSDGYTMITGNTSSFTKDEVFNLVLTRNEHFLGFVDEPTIYSDVFVERGKQSVMEKNLRLSEIDNVGEIDIYGNGYFRIRKQ